MNILIDIDGTICEDIPNAEDYRFINAKVLNNAVESVNTLYNNGHNITFFTARLTKHREVTEQWLKKHKFQYHSLIVDKPGGGNYFWIDNLDVTGIKYNDNWDNIVKSFN